MSKVLIISHADLDGVVSAVIAEKCIAHSLPREELSDIKITFMDYSPAEQFACELIEQLSPELKEVYILDLSLHRASRIALSKWLVENPNVQVTWIDHHATSTVEDMDEVPNLLTFFNSLAPCAAEVVKGVLGRGGAFNSCQEFNIIDMMQLAALKDQHTTSHPWFETADKLSDVIIVAGPDMVAEEIKSNMENIIECKFSTEFNQALIRSEKAKARSLAMGIGSKYASTFLISGGEQSAVFAVCSGFGSYVIDHIIEGHENVLGVVLDVTYGMNHETALRFKKTPDCELHVGKLAEALGGGGHTSTGGVVLARGHNEDAMKIMFPMIAQAIRNLCKVMPSESLGNLVGV